MRTSKSASNKGFVVLAALILVIVFGSIYSIKAVARDKTYFSTTTDQAESQYIKEVKEVLTSQQVYKAGVTMTKTTVDGSNVDYKVSIHASKYVYDHIDDLGQVVKALEDITLEVDNSNVVFSFD